MTESTENKLALRNNLGNERYGDKVKEDVRKAMTADDELAILRKAVALLFEVVDTLHHEEISNAEFKDYHNRIEAIKSKYKAMFG